MDVLAVDDFDFVDVAVTVADMASESDLAVVCVVVTNVEAEPKRAFVGEYDAVTHAVELVDCEFTVVGERDAHDAVGAFEADSVAPGLTPGAADFDPMEGVDDFVVDEDGDVEKRDDSVPLFWSGAPLLVGARDGVFSVEGLDCADALNCDAEDVLVGESLTATVRVPFARHDALTVPLNVGRLTRDAVGSVVVDRDVSTDGLADVVDDEETVDD